VSVPLPSRRTYTVAQGEGEWVILCGEMGGRVTGFTYLAYAVQRVVMLLDGAFDGPGEAGR
jgi:hypothetical protein